MVDRSVSAGRTAGHNGRVGAGAGAGGNSPAAGRDGDRGVGGIHPLEQYRDRAKREPVAG